MNVTDISNIWSNGQVSAFLITIQNFVLNLAKIIYPNNLFVGSFIVYFVPLLLIRKTGGLLLSIIISAVLAFLTVGHL